MPIASKQHPMGWELQWLPVISSLGEVLTVKSSHGEDVTTPNKTAKNVLFLGFNQLMTKEFFAFSLRVIENDITKLYN